MNNTAAVDFSDLEDAGEWSAVRPATVAVAKTDAAAQLGMGVARSRATVARFKCDKCRGSGRFISWAGRDCGACMKCKGGGLLKTDPTVLAKRREAAAVKKVEAALGWNEANPVRAQWIKANAGRFDFARNMGEAVVKFGSLTDGQIAAIDRCIERDAQRTQERAQAAQRPADAQVAGEGFARMLTAFAAAKASGLKFPKFTAGEITFSLASATSANAGSVYAKAGETYLGKISAAGDFRKSGDCAADQAATLAAICADPLAAAVVHGKQTGRCSCCGRTLENEESVRLGIGPICREKWGLN